ncbi:MAG: DnaD domain protein [Agathobaculum sp.]|uniref:DnaD domain-containing protein n=1 Tax=Agathobaculum sp. TaxID=2048138 RepID=UPI0025C4EB68|nr:DnaD domain protein [Agathobaculum sp.]MCI7125101.1 DnaD domain protein [Agathobaculum sp.]MDY3711586.1 DnaD domain protein [Agathobaculum sp.]
MPLLNRLPEGELRVAYCDMLDKLIAVGDGDAALLYLYILRHGGVRDEREAARALQLSAARMERALFTINGLTAPAAPPPAADKPAQPPQYTVDELRRARTDDHCFAAVCQAAEETLGRTLTEGQLRCLLTAYDHLGLDAGAIIELLAFLKKEKGAVRLADIRRETNRWADMGILSAQDAQAYLTRRANEKPLSEAIYKALAADPAQPAPKEQRVCSFALAHGFPPEAVALAVRRTERQQGHKSLDYTLGILRRWDEAGIHTESEITALEPESRAGVSKAVGQTAAQPTDAATLAAWEQQWQENHRKEIRRRRLEAEANGL